MDQANALNDLKNSIPPNEVEELMTRLRKQLKEIDTELLGNLNSKPEIVDYHSIEKPIEKPIELATRAITRPSTISKPSNTLFLQQKNKLLLKGLL